MVLLINIGVIGFVLHIRFDLTTQYAIVSERFLQGVPFFSALAIRQYGIGWLDYTNGFC